MNINMLNFKEGTEPFEKLERAFKKLAKKHRIELDVEKFHNYDDLKKAMLEDPNKTDVLTIDTRANQEKGIQTAKEIRESGYENIILFTSDKKSLVYEAFCAEPINFFIENETEEERVEKTLLRANEKIKAKKAEIISVACAGEIRNINLDDIFYFESFGRILEVHYREGVGTMLLESWRKKGNFKVGKKGKNISKLKSKKEILKASNFELPEEKTFKFYTSITKLQKILEDKGFLRIYKSLIVAKDKIKRIEKKEIELIDGTILPVGGTYYKEDWLL